MRNDIFFLFLNLAERSERESSLCCLAAVFSWSASNTVYLAVIGAAWHAITAVNITVRCLQEFAALRFLEHAESGGAFSGRVYVDMLALQNPVRARHPSRVLRIITTPCKISTTTINIYVVQLLELSHTTTINDNGAQTLRSLLLFPLPMLPTKGNLVNFHSQMVEFGALLDLVPFV